MRTSCLLSLKCPGEVLVPGSPGVGAGDNPRVSLSLSCLSLCLCLVLAVILLPVFDCASLFLSLCLCLLSLSKTVPPDLSHRLFLPAFPLLHLCNSSTSPLLLPLPPSPYPGLFYFSPSLCLSGCAPLSLSLHLSHVPSTCFPLCWLQFLASLVSGWLRTAWRSVLVIG